MSFQNLIESAKTYFPDLEIKYKTDSAIMKFIGTILFFNKSFMTEYSTTIGSTIYFPTEHFVRTRPVSASIILLHELVHINDAKKISKFLFSFLYLCPQILALLAIPLIFIHWYIGLPFLLLLLPIPAFFRMYFEKRAYFASLYVLNKFGDILAFDPQLDIQKKYFLDQFKSSSYYFMWTFRGLEKDFDDALIKIKSNQRPYDDDIFNILDDLTIKFKNV
jgi:hypothetical protein